VSPVTKGCADKGVGAEGHERPFQATISVEFGAFTWRPAAGRRAGAAFGLSRGNNARYSPTSGSRGTGAQVCDSKQRRDGPDEQCQGTQASRGISLDGRRPSYWYARTLIAATTTAANHELHPPAHRPKSWDAGA